MHILSFISHKLTLDVIEIKAFRYAPTFILPRSAKPQKYPTRTQKRMGTENQIKAKIPYNMKFPTNLRHMGFLFYLLHIILSRGFYTFAEGNII